MLEAKNRVGGRIQTAESSSGFPIELGASIVYPSNTLSNPHPNPLSNPLLTYLQALKIRTVALNPNNTQVFDALKHPLTLSEVITPLSRHFDAANMAVHEAKALFKRPISLTEALNPLDSISSSFATLTKQTITAMIEHQLGASLDNISIQELINPAVNQGDPLLVVGGLQRLTENLLQRAQATKLLSLRLNTPVKALRYNVSTASNVANAANASNTSKEAQVTVTTQNGKTFTASVVLCAVPLGVLKKQGIHFSPPLSAGKRQAIQHLGLGYQNKVYLEFEKAFWDKDAHFIFPGRELLSEWPEYLNLFALSNRKVPILVANFYAKAAQFKDHPDSYCVKKALLPLQKVFGKKMSALKSAQVTHWDSDNFILGSSSFCGLNYQPKDTDNLVEPERYQDNPYLYFAGEYTVPDHSSFSGVLRAFESGTRAALDIEASFNYRRDKTLTSHASVR